jgi:hypothetical protein
MIKKLRQFIVQANELEWPAFAKKNPYHVLVIIPGQEDESSPSETHEDFGVSIDHVELSGDFRAAVLRKKDGSPTINCRINVGRASANDVTLTDIQVSKFHASFDIDDDGSWSVVDGPSTNGTFLNGLRLPLSGNTPIESMDTLMFSLSLNAAFFSPEDFYHFLRSRRAQKAISDL